MASILVVDDDESAADLFASLLQRFGYDVKAAGSGEAALDYLNTDLPDLVILDLMMPSMNGVEVLKRIRAESRTASLPVVMYSALDDEEWREQAAGAGANAFWVKGGFDVGELEQTVRTCLPA